MDRLFAAWTDMSAGRKFIAVLATLAIIASAYGLTRGASAPNASLLYGGLEQRAAGEVVSALEQRGVSYEVRGDSIYVPQAMRDELRMALAADGLPANSAQGYELLDSLSGFGTTSQMFDAAYWRAKEGEIARTIVASPHIRTARVHISTPTNRPFQREDTPTAAVTVATTGLTLSVAQANALRFLVASSVSGLAPDDVAVIDNRAGLIGEEDDSVAAGAESMSAALRARAERLLFARVGPGNAVVEVSVDTVTETESIIERRIDPDSRVAISTQVEERSRAAQDSGDAGVTVASNLPTGDADAGGGSSNSQDSETRSMTNYEVSETSREVLREPGAVRRMTVAVLVNHASVTAEDGTTSLTPRGEEELASLRELVESAVGFDADRGDQITVQTLPFEPLADLGSEPQAPLGQPLDMMTLIQLGVLAVVALVLGLFVVRPILTGNREALPGTSAQELLPPETATPLDTSTPQSMTDAAGETIDAAGELEVDPVARLRRLIEERQDETVQILQSWIEDPDKKEHV